MLNRKESYQPMRQMLRLSGCVLCLMLLTSAATITSLAQANVEAAAQPREETSIFLSELASREPFVRQQAAEELARRADTEHLKLVEGYRLQEKNARVRVALDWALYRMGKNESLFALVYALDSSQAEQAAGYLTQLDSPQPLYIFLGRTKRIAQVRLLELLGEIGDAETLERIKPLLESFEPTVAVAAEHATEQINARLAQPQPSVDPLPTRPRQVGTTNEDTP
jgi:HEAT repeat protein